MRYILRTDGHAVLAVALIADDDALIARSNATEYHCGIDPESVCLTLACNASIRDLTGVHLIDSTDMRLETVVSAIVDLCNTFQQSGQDEPKREGK